MIKSVSFKSLVPLFTLSFLSYTNKYLSYADRSHLTKMYDCIIFIFYNLKKSSNTFSLKINSQMPEEKKSNILNLL
jgi:hypothetical protein